ncbi:unnamed protein product [Oikopleura dioica]|uniref:Reverse transcriptase domain-containing protein n=1 Tax=Oikopleura dioica TaxID=34765 RepID=E4X1H6_OIKDI|nr:unnamed protein product [Oikopleura dioica]
MAPVSPVELKMASIRPILPPLKLPTYKSWPKQNQRAIMKPPPTKSPRTSTPKAAPQFDFPMSLPFASVTGKDHTETNTLKNSSCNNDTARTNSNTEMGSNPTSPITRHDPLDLGIKLVTETSKKSSSDAHGSSLPNQTTSKINISGITPLDSDISTETLTEDDATHEMTPVSDIIDDNEPLTNSKLLAPKILSNIEEIENSGKFEEINLMTIRNEVRKDKVSKREFTNSMEIGLNFRIPKVLQEKIELMAGKDIDKEDIISSPTFRLKKHLKIYDMESYQIVRLEAEDKQKKLRKSLEKLRQSTGNFNSRGSEEITREKWIASVHYCAALGILTIKAICAKIKKEAEDLEDLEERMKEIVNLEQVRSQLIKLGKFYEDIRAVSEVAHLSTQLAYNFIPVPRSLTIYNIICEDIASKMGKEKRTMNFVHDMIRQRLMECGVRCIFARSHRIIIGFNAEVAQLPARKRPILGKSRQVSPFYPPGKRETVRVMLSSIICNDTDNEPQTFNIDNHATWVNRDAVIAIVSEYYLQCLKNENFASKFISKTVTKVKLLNNRVFRPRKQNEDLPTDQEPLNPQQAKVLQEEEIDGVRKSVNKQERQYLQEFYGKIPNEIKNILTKTHSNFSIDWLLQQEHSNVPELPRSNPTDFQHTSINDATILDTSNSENVVLNHPNSSSTFQIPRELPSSTINDQKIELSCRILNERAKKEIVNGTQIITANLGQISDPHILRLLVGIYPTVDIFLISEVMWDLNQLLLKTSWPLDFKILTHDPIGSSPLAYSFIMYNDTNIKNPIQKDSHGTFTSIEFGEEGSKSIVSVGYRFNDRPPETCLYNKYMNKDRFVFIDWTKQVILQQKFYKDAFIAGDLNTEIPARRSDDQIVARLLDDAFTNAGYSNLVTRSTFSRPNSRSSQIDFIMSKSVKIPPIQYLTMNQAPLLTDGHCGLQFEANAKPNPPEYEPCKVYKDHSRNDIFQRAMQNFSPYDEALDFDHYFEEICKILRDCQTVNIKAKRKRGFVHFNYSRCTWTQIHAINRIKKLLPDTYINSPSCKAHLRNLSNLLQKSKRDDEIAYGNNLGKAVEDRRHRIWTILKEATGAPPLSKLSQSVDVLAERVSDLQLKTITHDNPYDGHNYKLRTLKKLTRYKASYHGSTLIPSFRRTFDRLSSHTKGASGLSKQFLEKLPICILIEWIYKPMMTTIRKGQFPETLKISRVTILPKPKDGIRPISISEPLNSILEKLIITRLTPLIEINKLLDPRQNGFREGLNCSISLDYVIHKITDWYDKNKVVIAVTLDCANAFGTAGHKSISKMISKFTEGPAYHFLSNALERKFKVVKNGIHSPIKNLKPFGIPQGGILAPIIFSLYISQLTDILVPSDVNTSALSLFADDALAIVQGENHAEAVLRANELINRMTDKLQALGMSIVPAKTKVSLFGKFVTKEDFDNLTSVLGQEVPYAEHLKYLGTIITSDKGRPSLAHSNETLINKCKGVVSRIRSIRKTLAEDENSTILRSTTLGMILHNSEVAPKFSATDNTRFNKIFFTGLRNTVSSAWWFKKSLIFDDFAEKDSLMTGTLAKAKIPTNFIARLNVFTGLIFRLLKDCRSNRMRNVLFKHLALTSNQKRSEMIIPVPDIDYYVRNTKEVNLVKELFDDEIPLIKSNPFDELLIDTTLIFLKKGIIQINFVNRPSIRKLHTKIGWPWAFSDDFNDLDSQTRSQLLLPGGRDILRRNIHNIHPHQYQAVRCDKRCKKTKYTIPIEALDLRLRLDDTINTRYSKNIMRGLDLHTQAQDSATASSLFLELIISKIDQIECLYDLSIVPKILNGSDCSPSEILTEIANKTEHILKRKNSSE